MNRHRSILSITLGVACVVGYGLVAIAEEKAAAPAAAAVPAAAGDVVIFADDFNTDGKLGEWSDAMGVTEKDVSGGRVLLQCSKQQAEAKPAEAKEANAEEEVVEHTIAHLNYDVSDAEGNIAVEAKYDEFTPGNGGSFRCDLINTSSGDAVILGCWPSGKTPGVLVFNAGTKVAKNVPYTNPSGLLKLQFTAKTKALQAFYKETPEAEYKELPGSPCTLEGFEGGPYRVSFNVCASSVGTTSVKLDWAKITAPKDK